MKNINLDELSLNFSNNLKLNYNLKNKSWFNIGGKAKIYYKADNLKDLIRFLKKIENKKKIFVLGGGSNTLISEPFEALKPQLVTLLNIVSSCFLVVVATMIEETFLHLFKRSK